MSENSTNVAEIIKSSLTPEDYAAIYARKSNVKESLSLDTQIKRAKELAQKNNLIVYDIYKEQASATKHFESNRKEIQRLLQDAKENKFKTVIVFKRDRLARNIDDYYKIRNIFRENKINLLFTDDVEYISDNSMLSSLIESFYMCLSGLEAEIIKSRIEPGKENKRKRAEYFAPKVPFLYEKDDSEKPFKFKPKSQEASKELEELIKLYIDSNDYTSDVEVKFKELLDKYMDSKSKKIYHFNNFIKTPTWAGLQLKNLKYKFEDSIIINKDTNELELNREMYQKCTNVVPLISEELWFEAMKVWLKKSNYNFSHKKEYPFKNILYCGKCKKKIYLFDDTYHCKKNCFKVSVNEIQKILLSKLVEDIFKNDTVSNKLSDKITMLKDNIKKIEYEISNYNKQLNNKIMDMIKKNEPLENDDIKQILSKIKKLNNEKTSLESDLIQFTNCYENINFYKGFKENLEEKILSNYDDINSIIESIIERVVLNEKSNIQIEYK
ncbi:recombinase family protein [Thermobrachium celere]|nr:recombinase family protein [Thermobrachium celere]